MAGKADIVDSIVSNVEGLTKRQAGEAFDTVFETITDFLKKGDRVQLPSFGSFSVATRAARKGRNPRTGEEIAIQESNNVRFKTGKELKEIING